MKKVISLLIIQCICLTMQAQIILPDIPDSDSISSREYKGKIREKVFYKDATKVLDINYSPNYGSLSIPESQGETPLDSCYAFYNNNGNYDFYYFKKGYVINEKFSDCSNVIHHKKMSTYNSEVIESGQFYVANRVGAFKKNSPTYKMGIWKVKNKNGKTDIVNYNNFTINGEEIQFSGNKKHINGLKKATDLLIEKTYGSKFTEKYIKFNLDKSTISWSDEKDMSKNQPIGRDLMNGDIKEINSVDLCYDIILNDTIRFDIIMLRVLKDGRIMNNEKWDLITGLDNTGQDEFKIKLEDLEKIAKSNGYEFYGPDFNMKMEWNKKEGIYGDIKILFEQIEKVSGNEHSKTTDIKLLEIDPWTGKITEEKKEKEEEFSIIID